MERWDLAELVPLWVREHPWWSAFAAIGGTVLLILALIVRAKGDAGDAVAIIAWLFTDWGAGALTILGFSLLASIALPVILGGLGLDVFRHRKLRVDLVADLQHASQAIATAPTDDFDAWNHAVAIQQTYVIRCLRKARDANLLPSWFNEPLAIESPTHSWSLIAQILSEVYPERLLHPRSVARGNEAINQAGHLYWFITSLAEIPIWSEYARSIIDVLIQNYLKKPVPPSHTQPDIQHVRDAAKAVSDTTISFQQQHWRLDYAKAHFADYGRVARQKAAAVEAGEWKTFSEPTSWLSSVSMKRYLRLSLVNDLMSASPKLPQDGERDINDSERRRLIVAFYAYWADQFDRLGLKLAEEDLLPSYRFSGN